MQTNLSEQAKRLPRAEEAERERHGVEGVEGRNGAEVEQAVVGARAGIFFS